MSESTSTTIDEILIVDDTTANLELLTDILTRAGYKIHPASSGELALRSVKAKIPALILLDIKMPGMDGLEVCRQLKAAEKTRTIPVIFISALEDERSRTKGFQAGGVDCLTKPFSPEEILARVKTHLSVNRLQLKLERQNEQLLNEIEERKKTEEKFQQLVNFSPGGIYQTDTNNALKTLVELNQSVNLSLNELYDFALEKAISLCQSKIGFIGFLNQDESIVSIYTWSSSVMKTCEVKDKYMDFDVQKSGIWGEVIRQRKPVIINDFKADNPLKRGTPEGHVPITNYLSIPVFEENKIVAVLAVGNKEEDFNDTNIQVLTLLMDGVWNIVKQINSQIELEQKNTLIQTILDNLPIGLALNTINEGYATYMNKKFSEIYGWPEEELTSIASFFQKVFQDETYRKPLIERIMSDINSRIAENMHWENLEVTHKNGNKKIVNVVNIPLFEQNTMVSTVMDITELKQIESELIKAKENAEDSNAKYENLIQSVGEGFLKADKQGYITKANITIAEMCGYKSPEEMLGINMTKLYANPTDRDSMLEAINKNGVVKNYELELKKKDGTSFWSLNNISHIVNDEGNIIATQGLILDITAKKEAEFALSESELRWKFAIEGNSDGLWDWNFITNEVFFSEQWKKMLGLSANDISKNVEEWEKRVHPDDKEKVFNDINKHLSGVTDLYVNEHRVLCKDNSYKWILDRGKIISYTSDNKPERMIGTHSDISKRKNAEEALLENQYRFEKAQALGHVGNWEYNLESELFWVSDESKKIYGFDLDSNNISTEQVENCIPERERVHQAVIDLIVHDKKYDLEFEIIPADKTPRKIIHSIAELERDTSNNPLRVRGVILDITERKEAEQEVILSKEKLKKAQQIGNVGHWEYNIQHNKLYWSDQMYRIYEVSTDKFETTFENVVQLFHPEDKQNVIDEYNKSVENKTNFEITHRIITQSGNLKYITERASTKYNENGQALSTLGTILDVTKLKLAEQTLNIAKKEADKANRLKSEFLANMSHELRTPLNAILGFSRLTSRSPHLSPEDKENLGIIRRSGEHLLSLINDVLDMSKIEAGRTALNENDFDLHQMLDNLEDMLRIQVDEKGLQIFFERAANVPRHIRADELKLRQVLINLLNNAVKFIKKGQVQLLAKCEQPAGKPESENKLIFEIRDTGPGIAPDELDSLFEAFSQTKTGRASQEGTGLGLSISRNFVQLMGGDITVSSEVGRGTVFRFNIRAQPVESSDKKPPLPVRRVVALKPGQPRYRILIADDKADNRQLLVKLLKTLEFELREAENGQDAVEIWKEWDPHLIWMDMRMPVMDGYEATQIIKKSEKGQATAVVALTTSVYEEEQGLVLSAGCDDFVPKPFRDAEIFDVMHRHLGVRYVYEEDADAHDPVSFEKARPKAVTPEALGALPHELLTALEKASMHGDTDRVERLIEDIRSIDGALADALAVMAAGFDHDNILRLIETSRGDKK